MISPLVLIGRDDLVENTNGRTARCCRRSPGVRSRQCCGKIAFAIPTNVDTAHFMRWGEDIVFMEDSYYARLAPVECWLAPLILDRDLTRATLDCIAGAAVGATRPMRDDVWRQQPLGRNSLPLPDHPSCVP
jgi:hypothetical protein